MLLCQYCHKEHDGSYGSGRFCSPQCASKSRIKNRRKTITKKKRSGQYKKFNPKVSKLQKKVSRILSKHGIQHKVQEQVGKYYFDIKIGNILIEVNGDYWHANPKFYRGNQIIKYPGRRKKLVANIWKKDLKKMLQARKKGYRVIYLWENDINNWTEGQLIQNLQRKILNKV